MFDRVRSALLLLLVLALVGCPSPDPEGDDDTGSDDDDSAGLQTWYRDGDSDGWGDPLSTAETVETPQGFVENDGDCDDTDPAVHPDAEEVCNDRDDDCDELVDEELPTETWFVDGDGDGFGLDSSAVEACQQPPEHVDAGGDCNDVDAAVHPGAEELCNDRDDDCDGVADADHPDASSWHPDADGDGFGDAAITVSACDEPDDHLVDASDCDDGDAGVYPGAAEVCDDGIDQDCDGIIDTGCVFTHCGDITADETWGYGVIHVVTCNVFVDDPSDPTLTVADGAVVRFAPGAELFTGYDDPGRLVVDGQVAGVLFTPHAALASPGDWPGISIWNQDSGSELTGLTIEYGGDNGRGNIRVNDASPVLEGVLSRYSSEAGLQSNMGDLSISGSSFVDNAGFGIELMEDVELSVFDGNTLSGNTDPIVLGAVAVDALDDTSTFTGNMDDLIQVLGGDVEETVVWQDPGVPLIVQNTIYAGGLPPITLELADGLELRFESNKQLRIGQGGEAALVVSGSAAGVLLTSAEAVPAAGDWGGLVFAGDALASSLAGLTIEYAGASGQGGIRVESNVAAQIALDDVVVREGGGWGLDAEGGVLEVSGSTFEANALGGVLLEGNAELLNTGGSRTFVGNTIIDNPGPALVLPADEADQVDATLTSTGNLDDRVRVAGSVTETGEWAGLPVVWSVEGILHVGGSSVPALEITDGSLLEFEPGAGLMVGQVGPAILLVYGWSSGVTFTSALDAPQPGDWEGVTFWGDTQGIQLEGLTVEYGGANGFGNLRFFQTSTIGSVNGCAMNLSSTYGIHRNFADPSITSTTYTGNVLGDLH